MFKNLLTLNFLSGYRTIAAALAAIAVGVVSLCDHDYTSGVQSISLGLGLLGIRFQDPTPPSA